MKAVDANGKSGEVTAPIFELTEDEKEMKEKKPSAFKSFLSMFGEIWRVMTSNFPKALVQRIFDFFFEISKFFELSTLLPSFNI